MARQSGRWLAYLRFQQPSKIRVLHVLCVNRQQLDEVLTIAKELAPESGGMVLTEYAVWYSGRNIYTIETPNFPERHIVTHKEFVAAKGLVVETLGQSA